MSWNSRFNDVKKQVGKLVTEGSEFFDEVPKEIEERRKLVCENCPDGKLITESKNSNFWKCDECGCFYKLKVKLESQSCPLDYW